jgi:hypothetical protein
MSADDAIKVARGNKAPALAAGAPPTS